MASGRRSGRGALGSARLAPLSSNPEVDSGVTARSARRVTVDEDDPPAGLRRPGLGTVLYAALVAVMASVPLLRGRDFVVHDSTILMPDLNETVLSTMAAQHRRWRPSSAG